MNDGPGREDGEIERLRAEAAALRGKIDRLECDRRRPGAGADALTACATLTGRAGRGSYIR